MIAHIFGMVSEKLANVIIVDVMGIGFEINVTAGDYDKAILDHPIKMYTYHYIREQSQDLFGFTSLATKKLFELLITVQGIGPKAALAILSIGAVEEVRNAIANSDASYITKAAGVGKRTAERVVVDLSDKVGLPTRIGTSQVQTAMNVNDEAMDALVALGYSLNDASIALTDVPSDLSTTERVRRALQSR